MPKVIVLDTLAQEGLDLLAKAPGRPIRSPHRTERRRAALGAGRVRRRDLPQRRQDHGRSPGGQSPPEGDRAGRRRHRQHRLARRHAAGHRGDEHAGRQHAEHGRAHAGHDAGPVAQHRPRLSKPDRRQVGPQPLHGHPTGRQDAGHRRPGTHRPGRRRAGPGPGKCTIIGYDPFLSSERAAGAGHRAGGQGRRHAPARRLSDGAHAADRRNAQPDQHVRRSSGCAKARG